MKHTQGEWSFNTPIAINNEEEPKHLISIYAVNGTHICDKKIISKLLPIAIANAKLITAAPDLLEALKELTMLVSFDFKNTEAVKKANAAIKKATA